MLPDVFNNVFLLDFAFETTQCIFNGLTFMNPNLRHSVPPTSVHYQNGSVYSCCYGIRLGLSWLCRFCPSHSWTVFLVAVEYFQEESLCVLPRSRAWVGVKREGEQYIWTKWRPFAF